MRRILVMIGLAAIMLWSSGVAGAAEGTVEFAFGNPIQLTVPSGQVAKLAAFIAKVNAERAAQDPPLAAVTIEQYLRATLTNTVRDQVQQGTVDEIAQACVAYKAKSPAAQTQINDEGFGGLSPCP